MQLTISDIEKVANLARLSLSEVEKKQYADQLSVVFDYVDMLNEVDINGVEETCQVTGLVDIVRIDDVNSTSTDTIAKIKNQFPEEKNGYLKVKAVFSETE